MSTRFSRSARLLGQHPTIWGLRPVELHDRYWAGRGVCVVRPGEARPLPRDAELYLLTELHSLVLLRLDRLLDTLSWVEARLLLVRVRDTGGAEYREVAVADETGQFRHFDRLYRGKKPRVMRIALTRDRELAAKWQAMPDHASNWKQLGKQVSPSQRRVAAADGSFYDRDDDAHVERLVQDLLRRWPQPGRALPGVTLLQSGVWAHEQSAVDPSVTVIGPAWIGAGRAPPPRTCLIGPAVLWDNPACKPLVADVDWRRLQPTPAIALQPAAGPRLRRSFYQFTKRLFDIAAALIGILLTLPIQIAVIIAIWREDGGPIFFVHRRETVGGREFGCLKFRSMRKGAERAHEALKRANHADGPQFYLPEDPRITRVGRFIRRTNIDELPQFINVLLGDMSIIGPRPSPFSENQYCPAWREARLSVRPGITGLWQVMRTRQDGLDFQEWIRYDLEYVQNASWTMDLQVFFKTVRVLIGEAIPVRQVSKQ